MSQIRKYKGNNWHGSTKAYITLTNSRSVIHRSIQNVLVLLGQSSLFFFFSSRCVLSPSVQDIFRVLLRSCSCFRLNGYFKDQAPLKDSLTDLAHYLWVIPWQMLEWLYDITMWQHICLVYCIQKERLTHLRTGSCKLINYSNMQKRCFYITQVSWHTVTLYNLQVLFGTTCLVHCCLTTIKNTSVMFGVFMNFT